MCVCGERLSVFGGFLMKIILLLNQLEIETQLFKMYMTTNGFTIFWMLCILYQPLPSFMAEVTALLYRLYRGVRALYVSTNFNQRLISAE